ncbi:GNAT family N-acetyltransferase [Peribacillus frigoritolerans]|uniref:GNAT family N-acetyltransferase n=1 Tax=Peribacillus frigoritolerans TaxID=450367 RepID=UPI00105A2B5F|nr:GNAT family protein [Peribacillus frigoritolerans]TDL82637.1 N-acetyltransferase [Peribacillus frigoritolerans]
MITQEINTVFTAKNGEQVTLRQVREEDAEDIIQSVKSIIDSGTYIQKERARFIQEEVDFISEMREKNNLYLGVELKGKIVGIARVIRGELEMKKHTGLFRTWLSDSAQGLGIGKELMNATLEWCRSNNLHKLCLTVFASNEIALKLYQKYGFVIEGTQREQVILNGKFDDEIHMAYFFKSE